jgi:hypothetical protein
MLAYLKRRLEERTTWAAIGAAIPAAAALPWPWNLASVIVAAMVAIAPSSVK